MREDNPLTIWRVVQAAGVLIVMGFFLLETLPVLNPALLFLLMWAVLLPFRGREGYTVLLAISATLTLFWLLSASGSVLAPFFLSGTLAYVLDPLVDRLEARGVRRHFAVLMLIVPSIALIAVLLFVSLPSAFENVGELLQLIPVLVERVLQWYADNSARLEAVNVPFFDGAAIVAHIESIDTEAIVGFMQERQSAFGTWLWETVLGLGRGLGSITTILSYVVLTPVLTYYLIRDWDHLIARIQDMIPVQSRERVSAFALECNGLVSSYLRGQLTVALIIGILTGVGYHLLSFPYATSMGLVAGVFSIVPYLGSVITLVPAIFIALVSGSVWASLGKVLIVFVGVQLLDGSVISPKIVGDSVGIHPVWVVLAMTSGGYAFGVVGLLVAVPAAAIIKLLIGYGMERYLASEFYRGTESGEADSPR